MQYAMFIGRWSPFHLGHSAIINRVLAAGDCVLIAIRDTEISPDDPWPVSVRKAMIKSYYDTTIWKNSVRIITIPDIHSIHIGRAVGYKLVEHESDGVFNMSGTEIRNLIKDGHSRWECFVSASVVGVIKGHLVCKKT